MNYYQIRYFREDGRGCEPAFNYEMFRIIVMTKSPSKVIKEWCEHNPLLHTRCDPQQKDYGLSDTIFHRCEIEKIKTHSFQGYDSYHSMHYTAYYFYIIEKIGYDQLEDSTDWKKIKIIDQEAVDQIKKDHEHHDEKHKKSTDKIVELEKELKAVKRKRSDDVSEYNKKYRESVDIE